jgi:hypothetical protein
MSPTRVAGQTALPRGTPFDMQPSWCQIAVLGTAIFLTACGPPSAPPVVAAPTEHHHEPHLPLPGPTVHVTLDGKSVDVLLPSVPHDGSSVSVTQLWKAAWPSEDPAPLHFDLVGSDGFHPTSRPSCPRLLTGAEIAAARIEVVTHDITFDDALKLPGCYRVKAVVQMDATR